jgi:hypothetical protein
MPARALGTLIAWLAATGLGITVSWYGLRPVLDTAVPDRATPLSAADLRNLAPVPVATPPPLPSGPASSGPASSGPASSGPSPASSKPPLARSSPPARVVDGWTVITESDGSTSYLRTLQSIGGDAAVRVRPGTASLVSATPRPGYTVTVLQPAPTRVVVQFVRQTRMSTVDALWWDDHPFAQVSETPPS